MIRTPTKIIAILSFTLSILTFSHCSIRPKTVTIKIYTITSTAEITRRLTPQPEPFPFTLIMPPVLGSFPLRTKKIFYRSTSVSVGPYVYSRWEYPPTHMMLLKMLKTINQARLFSAVAYSSTGAKGNLYLETTLLDFTHHIPSEGNTSFGVVSAMFHLIDGETRTIIATNTLTIKKPAPTIDAEGAATALNEASTELCLKLVEWLRNATRTYLSRKADNN